MLLLWRPGVCIVSTFCNWAEEPSSPLSCTDCAELSQALFSLKGSWNFRAFSHPVNFAPTKHVCWGWTRNDWHCRTYFFLWVGGRLSSAHRVRDYVMPCEHLFSDNDWVEYSTSSRMCSIFFYYETKPVIMAQRGLRLQCNVPKRGPIPSCNTILVWVLQPSYLLRNTRPSISVWFFFYAQRNILALVVLRSRS
jgi:hypothetical protein